jgi:hypothetical protein
MRFPLGPLLLASVLIGLALGMTAPQLGVGAGLLFFVLFSVAYGVAEGMREGLHPKECGGCGYSLEGLDRRGKCPECGRRFRR